MKELDPESLAEFNRQAGKPVSLKSPQRPLSLFRFPEGLIQALPEQ